LETEKYFRIYFQFNTVIIKKYNPSGNLKFNYLGIFRNLKERISMEKKNPFNFSQAKFHFLYFGLLWAKNDRETKRLPLPNSLSLTFQFDEFRVYILSGSWNEQAKLLRLTDSVSWGGTHKRQISKPPTPYPPVSISTSNHNRQSQRLR